MELELVAPEDWAVQLRVTVKTRAAAPRTPTTTKTARDFFLFAAEPLAGRLGFLATVVRCRERFGWGIQQQLYPVEAP